MVADVPDTDSDPKINGDTDSSDYMMNRSEEWKETEERYDTYIESYPEESILDVQYEGEVVDYPLKWAHQTGTPVVIDVVELIDTEYLISFDQDFPGYDQFSLREKADFPILLTRLGQVKSTQDHHQYWQYSFEEFYDFFGRNTDQYDNVLKILQTAVVLSCAVTAEEAHPSFFEEKSYLLSTYVTFPLLETLLKGFCEEDIRMDGTVKAGCRVRRLGSEDSHYEENKICSDLGSLFFHLEEEIADDFLKCSLEEFRKEIANFGEVDKSRAYGLLKNWRNGLLHGQHRPIGQFLINTNLVFFLMWHFVRDIYN